MREDYVPKLKPLQEALILVVICTRKNPESFPHTYLNLGQLWNTAHKMAKISTIFGSILAANTETNLTRYSKRYLTALATSYWLDINTIQSKHAAVFSRQEVQFRMYAMTQLPLIMQCTDKGSMVRAQYCSEWTELGYGMACLFDSFVPR